MYKEIFESSPTAIIIIDKNGIIRLTNKCAEDLFSYSKNELMGKNISILLPNDLKSQHSIFVGNYFLNPQKRQMGEGRKLYGLKKDHKTFPIEVGLSPIHSKGETLAMSTVIDITERLKVQKRFEAAFEAAPNGMLMIDAQGKILLTNKKLEEIFGYSKLELIGMPVETLVPMNSRKNHPLFVQSYISNPQPRLMGEGRELFGQHKSGELIAVEVGLQPLSTQSEIFVISSIVDITKRKHSEELLKNKSNEIEEFAYRTSHDLRAPLLTISALSDFIIEDIENEKPQEALTNIKKIKSVAVKLNTLIEDILILTKLDQESEPTETFNFNAFIDSIKQKFDIQLQENKVEVLSSFSHQKQLITQKTRLTQILENLISNSIKYNQNGFVKILTFNSDRKFHIQVIDDGLGIPQDSQKDVFKMFKRFHSQNIPGSGLGLYMIKKHCEKLNSKVSFESSDKGTIFYLEFDL
ncbi:MAG: hypothetical protein CME66_13605 [Halobacteriovoraceae bacterium]|nr:hypothetical protein [Halobacteriovoraceae bacterium]|tara:strand:- start:181 stop:1581 length:1401 start_codon:yes stop_codon:yes gene_type:complete